jgi:transcription elongation factor Elf1
MAKSGNKKITITLNQTTVDVLRRRKRGTSWDVYLLKATNRKCGIECMNCGKWIEAQRTDISQDTLAKYNGWKPMVIYGEETVGFLCDECMGNEGVK